MSEAKNNDIIVDKKVAKAILRKIVLNEVKNMKTKEKNDGQMVAFIQKTIEEEVGCY